MWEWRGGPGGDKAQARGCGYLLLAWGGAAMWVASSLSLGGKTHGRLQGQVGRKLPSIQANMEHGSASSSAGLKHQGRGCPRVLQAALRARQG